VKKLTLLRHGKTGLSGRYVGATDVPLSAEGVLQIEKLSTVFDADTLDAIVSSPMLRCQQSCEILFPDRTVLHDGDLREIDFGRWEKLSFDEIVERDPERVAEWSHGSPDFCFPEGECVGDFIERINRAGARISDLSCTHCTLIAHGGVIRGLLCYFLKLDPSQYLIFEVQKGRYATIDIFDEGAVLTGFNLGA